jgi:hypothetical protein
MCQVSYVVLDLKLSSMPNKLGQTDLPKVEQSLRPHQLDDKN